jgi:hypothetical protein
MEILYIIFFAFYYLFNSWKIESLKNNIEILFNEIEKLKKENDKN